MPSARIAVTWSAIAMLPLAGCSSLGPSEDPVALKVTDLEARLIRIERVLQNQSLIDLASQLEQLRSETQELRGAVDTLRHDSETTAARQRDLYVDVAQRLQALEQGQARVAGATAVAGNSSAAPAPTRSAAVSGPAPTPSTASVGVTPAAGVATGAQSGNDQENYQAAFDLLRNAKYEESAQAFEAFLAAFPSSPLADNAQYWLAETYYVRRQFEDALPQFQKVIDGYPNSSKLPDALLKVGFCNYELKRMEPARTALQQVARQFPDTTAARLATQRLERIAQEGG
jgi:tol-pal system protein YbgF